MPGAKPISLLSGAGPQHHKPVFLTGGGGVVGQALIRQATDRQFLCLSHKRPLAASNAAPVPGDVCHPRLGMDADTYARVADGIDCIIHSAAITDFTKPAADIAAVNVEGTIRMLDLAARANVPVYHVSTAFIRPHATSDPTPYELSKIKAEEEVRKSGLPATILRPSVILGDALTGEIASFQGFHFLIGVFLKGQLPFVPASPDSYIDFVPQNLVADTLMALIRQGRIGEDIWLTAGPRALRIDNIVDYCLDEMTFLVPPPARPDMISRDTYDRLFKPVFYPSLSKHQRRLMDRAMTMVKYLNSPDILPSDLAMLEQSLEIEPMPDPRATLRASLYYWARSRGLASDADDLGAPRRRLAS